MIYLDYAAATPIDAKVLAAMMPYLTDLFYNPSANYMPAVRVRNDFEDARHRIASIIGARPTEIIFTAGATESVNLALLGVDGKIVTTVIEHMSVLNVVKNRDGKILPVDEKGQINLNELKSAITDDVELVSIGYANSEIGTVQEIEEIARIIADIRVKRREHGNKTPLYLHTDASAAAGLLDINVARLGVDLMTLNAGKCYGPKQVGLLYVRAGIVLKPLIVGGGQELGLRSGTENVAGAVGFAKALELAEKHRKNEVIRLAKLRDDLQKFLVQEFPDIVINGSQKHRLPNLLNFSLPGLDGERAVFALDQNGVCVATGSACAANKGSRSHVLTAIGLTPEIADGSIRISLGRSTTDDEIAALKPILRDILRHERELS
ncbi:cysteine desulfurase [Candidatus Saccharibacteria bacterium]|nr:cysteine desulfurase [Candidatus Saccharibacteria bacterium]MCL1962892.1 cysteine desulfurase [Candidatus Saccharibacteria bacterium]